MRLRKSKNETSRQLSSGAWPADKVERRPISSLLAAATNARTHSDDQIAQIADSIRTCGWTNPVLVTEGNTIICGEGRVRAAKKLGLQEVPVMVATGWTEAQKRAFALADNKLALNAGWDEALLALELGELKGLGFDLGTIGFSDREVQCLLEKEIEGLTDPDAAPELPIHPVSRSGDIWLLGPHRLACGDCTDEAIVERLLGKETPQLMVTDPPYGVDYDPQWRVKAGVNNNKNRLGRVTNDNRADWRDAWAGFTGSVAYVWHAGRHTSEVQASLEAAGFEMRSQIIWAKDRFALSRSNYHWQHEPCWYAVRGGSANWKGDRKQSTLWEIQSREGNGLGHPTQKPVECMKRPILNNSAPGQSVYEPFMGSGTTMIAAQMTGRISLGVEIDPAFADIAVRRWQAFTGKAAILEQDGRTFTDVASTREAAPTA